MRKKEESTTDFLITYGWAILVIILGIGSLFYSGEPSERCRISGSSGLSCTEFTISPSASSISLNIKNSLAENLTIKRNSSAIGPCAADSDVAIQAKNESSITFSCAADAVNMTSGNKIKESISLVFEGADKISKTAAGSLIAKVP